MTDREPDHTDGDPTPEAPDPSGTYSDFPGRTGKHPDGETPGDQTVPIEDD